MNFSQVIEQGNVVVELKYCERCGGLWLRRLENKESYCDNCRVATATWPGMRRGGTGGKTAHDWVHKRGQRNTEVSGNVEPLVIEILCGISDSSVANRQSGEPEVRV